MKPLCGLLSGTDTYQGDDMPASLNSFRRTTIAITVFVAVALVAQVLVFPSRAEAIVIPPGFG